jgi:hypothetical protein
LPKASRLKEEAPPARHKAKPKFDIPVTAAPPEAAVGWVYRAEEAEKAVPIPPAPQPPPVSYPVVSYSPPAMPPTEREQPAVGASAGNPFLMVARGLFLVGLGSLNIAAIAAQGMIMTPLRLAKWMLASDRK